MRWALRPAALPQNRKMEMRGELIGLNVEIVYSKNPGIKGIKGSIIDETKNTFLVETENGRKKILKEQCIFEFEFPDKKVRVEGKLLLHRPEDRLKIRKRKIK